VVAGEVVQEALQADLLTEQALARRLASSDIKGSRLNW
jgi:hypothetical protein